MPMNSVMPGSAEASRLDRFPGNERTLKKQRNLAYIICAARSRSAMIIAFVANFLPESIKSSMPSLFWFEAIAVVAFSVSWLVKGETFSVLNDK
jgi:hypothetical protein